MSDHIKFCHLSDSHLGCFQYHLRARAEDFGRAFDDALALIAAERPDFVIHTGDLFDRSLPHPLAIEHFRIACKAHLVPRNIPFILLAGNHDLAKSARGATMTFHQRWKKSTTHHLLEEQGLAIFVDDALHFQKDASGSPLALILGVRYHGKQTCTRLLDLVTQSQGVLAQYRDVPRIALLHLLVKGIPFHVFDFKPEDIDPQRIFHYIGIGHWHQRHENAAYNIYCPGSTEHTSPLDWANKPGFFVVNMHRAENWHPHVHFVPLPHIRPKLKVEIHQKSSDPEENIKAIRSEMHPYNQPAAIVRYHVIGQGPQVAYLKKKDFLEVNDQTFWFYFGNQKKWYFKPHTRSHFAQKQSLQAKLDEFM